jgi:hypothetical protein
MTRQIILTDDQEIWLAKEHSNLTHQQLSVELGCCVDTLKRILMKRGLQYFPGAKYQFKEAPPMWQRPCSSCGCTKLRPKFQYRCDACHEKEEGEASFFSYGSYQSGSSRPTLNVALMFTN